MNIMVLMGGSSSSFYDAGYKFCKPLIEVGDKMIVEKVVNNLSQIITPDDNVTFIVKKEDNDKKILQEIYDFTFRQVELSIREIGYGDQSINKKMKDYLNLFYGMIDKIHDWDNLSTETRAILLENFLDNAVNTQYLADYFEKFRVNLINNSLNSHIKGVLKH